MNFTTLELRMMREAVFNIIETIDSNTSSDPWSKLLKKISEELDAEDVGPSEDSVWMMLNLQSLISRSILLQPLS